MQPIVNAMLEDEMVRLEFVVDHGHADSDGIVRGGANNNAKREHQTKRRGDANHDRDPWARSLGRRRHRRSSIAQNVRDPAAAFASLNQHLSGTKIPQRDDSADRFTGLLYQWPTAAWA